MDKKESLLEAQSEVIVSMLPVATQIGARRMHLAEGPKRAWPTEQEQVLEDGSKSQRYQTGSISILRRTCAPRDRAKLKTAVWWEFEV